MKILITSLFIFTLFSAELLAQRASRIKHAGSSSNIIDDGGSQHGITVETEGMVVEIKSGKVTSLTIAGDGSATPLRSKTTEVKLSRKQLKALKAGINKVIKRNPGASKVKLESLIKDEINGFSDVEAGDWY